MTSTFVDAIASIFTSKQVNVEDLPTEDPSFVIGKKCEALLTAGVDVLRAVIPNDRVQTLARVLWDIVGHKQVLTAIHPSLPSLTFVAMRHNGAHQGYVLVPRTWPELVDKDPFMQLGAILFIGAQAVDFYNDRLRDKHADLRWQAYEAELLHTFKQTMPRWVPNAYQLRILEQFPQGLDSPGVDLYVIKGFVPAQGNA